MAKDDYHVIVYQILSYLYSQLKNGQKIDENMLLNNGDLFKINEAYWEYIIYNLFNDGYITGIRVKSGEYMGGITYTRILDLDRCQITPKGIEYLTDNSFMNKAMDFFKDVKSIIPFV